MTHDIDVLVCGGGCAGLGAAVSAARNGAKVLLIERAPFSGGILTTVGLPFLDGIACWHTNRLVVRGLALDLLVRLGAASSDAQRLEDFVHGRALLGHGSATITNTDQFKILADEVLSEAGVRVLYHSMACGVDVRGSRIREVTIANKDGLTRLAPKVVVDCTGDADLAFWSGCPMDSAQERMPMTMHFRIGNVRYQPETYDQALAVVKQAHTDGLLPHFYGPGFGPHFAPDEAYVHAVRVPGNAVDAADLTRAEIQGRRDAWTMFSIWKAQVRGFEDSYFIGSGPYIGVRETRRISGRHVLSEDDLRTCRRFDDAIATGSWYADIHPNFATPGGANTESKAEKFVPMPYDIPYGSILPHAIDNLLVAGRCHSASRVAASSTRVTVTAMALGEAAGTAAALAVCSRRDPVEIAGTSVRKQLSAMGGGPFTGP